MNLQTLDGDHELLGALGVPRPWNRFRRFDGDPDGRGRHKQEATPFVKAVRVTIHVTKLRVNGIQCRRVIEGNGRGEWIRTTDLLVPNLAAFAISLSTGPNILVRNISLKCGIPELVEVYR